MIDVVDHCYDFLTTLCGPFGDTIVEHVKQRDLLPVERSREQDILNPSPLLCRSFQSLKSLVGAHGREPWTR
jgi:hypothetical protein